MNLDRVKELLDLMKANNLTEIEIEEEGMRIRLQKGSPPAMNGRTVDAALAEAPAPERRIETPAENAGRTVNAPMVGTFYRAPSPDVAPYIDVGDRVTADTVVCIIEAMKVMNEIKAGMGGEVTEVLAESGGPVEFGQALFRIKS